MDFWDDLWDTATSGVEDLGEMAGNIVGGTLEGLGGALRDPTFVMGALAMAGLAYAGPGLFADSAGNILTAEQAAGAAGVTPAEIASLTPANMADLAPTTMPGLGAETASTAYAFNPELAAGYGAETIGTTGGIAPFNPELAAGYGAETIGTTGGIAPFNPELAAGYGAETIGTTGGVNSLAPTLAGVAGANALGTAGAGAAGAGLSQYLTPAAIAGSALLGANAAQSAAQTQANAQQQANELMYKMYQEQKAQQAPFREAGLTAQNRMLDLLGLSANTGAAGYGSLNKPFGMEQFQADPGYAFRLSEGVKALERSRAMSGGLLSGATGKALTRYGQELGSQEYGNAFTRYQTERANQLNPLAALTAAGQGSANVLGQAAGTYGQQAGAGITNIGAAQAAGNVGMANALAGGVGQYLGYMQNQNLADAILQRRSQYDR